VRRGRPFNANAWRLGGRALDPSQAKSLLEVARLLLLLDGGRYFLAVPREKVVVEL
jgi:hypothetical protein